MASGSEVRQRKAGDGGVAVTGNRNSLTSANIGSRKPFWKPFPQTIFIGLFVLHLMLLWFIRTRDHVYPTPKIIATAEPGEFVEERASRYLTQITDLGPRPVGSSENEVKVVEILVKEIEKIKLVTTAAHVLDVEVQSTSGVFTLDFIAPFTSVYQNINNILVKLSPKVGASSSLMVNCHYDSIIHGTGASDDAVSCSLMLEVLRVLATTGKPLLHSIVFVFNGAEENVLQASHGFITQHKWAQKIMAFVNLDAAGAGGREILFQAGPENPWMVHTYAENVPHPFASVIGQELFESGIIPSDTDYRIFRDYGGLPGLDIAYIANGYVYHTPFDTPDKIPSGCIQRGGENLLALVKALATTSLLENPGEYRHGKLVFFDVLGYHMIVYPLRVATIINTVAVLAVVLGVAKKGLDGTRSVNGQVYTSCLLKTMVSLVLSWIFTILIVVCVGVGLDAAGHPMSWFTNTWLLLPLFAAPALLVMIFIHSRTSAIFKAIKDPWEIEGIYLDANLCIFSILLTILTVNNVSSAIIFLLYVIFPLLVRIRTTHLLTARPQDQPWMFLLLHTAGVTLSSVLWLYHINGTMAMFIPIMGRAGPGAVPDVFIGAVVAVATVLSFTYHVGLVHLCRSTRLVQIFLAVTTIVGLALVFFTPHGFPYKSDPAMPTKQRHFVHPARKLDYVIAAASDENLARFCENAHQVAHSVSVLVDSANALCNHIIKNAHQHTERIFHDVSGKVTQQDHGIFHVSFDRNSISLVREHMEAYQHTEPLDCMDVPYCGIPFYLPLFGILSEVYYLPTNASPNVSPRPRLKMLEKIRNPGAPIERIYFNITGPSHTNVYMATHRHCRIMSWSLSDTPPAAVTMPPGVIRPHYFVYQSYGTKPDQPWKFSVDIKCRDDVDRSNGTLQIALNAHYIRANKKEVFTPELRQFLKEFPDWTVPMGWPSIYEMWTY